MNNTYCLPAGDLASRRSAIVQRKQLEQLFCQNRDVIFVDVKEVQSISESYADEVFGVLVMQYGVEEILERIKIVNANTYALQSIAAVIDRRVNSTVCNAYSN